MSGYIIGQGNILLSVTKCNSMDAAIPYELLVKPSKHENNRIDANFIKYTTNPNFAVKLL